MRTLFRSPRLILRLCGLVLAGTVTSVVYASALGLLVGALFRFGLQHPYLSEMAWIVGKAPMAQEGFRTGAGYGLVVSLITISTHLTPTLTMKELPRVLLPLFKLHTLGLVMCAVSGACTGLLVFCVFSITHYYPSNGDWPLSHPFMPREILIAESAYLGARYGVSIYMLAGFGIAAFNLIRRFEFILE